MIFLARNRTGIIFLFSAITSSCYLTDLNFWDVKQLPFFTSKEIIKEEMCLKQARGALYENDLNRCDSLLSSVDTLKLSGSEKGFYFLTKGFSDHKNGYVESALKNIERASGLLSRYGDEADKAEEHLIWGLIYEDVNLPSKAAESYFKALDHYQIKFESKLYFYVLLGLARTSPDKSYFMKKAQDCLDQNSSKLEALLFCKTKAYLSSDVNERHRLFLQVLNNYYELHDTRGKINLYVSLALNCQLKKNNDSANYYLAKAKRLADENVVSNSRLVHYYLIKAYIDMKSGRFSEARSTIDSTIIYAKDQPGLLSQAYLRKHRIESIDLNYSQANNALLRHLKYEKQEIKRVQDSQLSLMTIHHKLNRQQLELLNTKSRWLSGRVLN